jgi:hypothetical protein
MAPRCRGHSSWRLQTLKHDLELLILGPAPTTTRLDHLEPFNLSTALMAVRKDSYTSLNLSQQGGLNRRETAKERREKLFSEPISVRP